MNTSNLDGPLTPLSELGSDPIQSLNFCGTICSVSPESHATTEDGIVMFHLMILVRDDETPANVKRCFVSSTSVNELGRFQVNMRVEFRGAAYDQKHSDTWALRVDLKNFALNTDFH
ncbi:hypothetical protein EDD21DRAFT_353756 [Dissophora ornata]|nr:hypothetical protein BGZ58_000164 [Dissophora ornata]KAI8601340.1 hypothetical protein EDD21DRAFT_353756 [Dissophora ornata]